jgi:hypothetical protein
MPSPPLDSEAPLAKGRCAELASTAPTVSAAKKFVNRKPRRELSYRKICEIMGRNLRIINPPEPEEEQLDLFEAAQGERR